MAKGLKHRSLEAHLTAVMLMLALLPAAAVGWTAYNVMSEYIRSDHLDTVGRVANAKRSQLVTALKQQNERAKSFLSNLVAQCGHSAARPDSACAVNLVESHLAAEKALGATVVRAGSAEGLSVGSRAMWNGRGTLVPPGQLAQFSGAGPEKNRSYFISVEEPAGTRLVITYPSSTLEPVFAGPSAELGASGEILLTDGEGYFANKPRYSSTLGHRLPVSARPMQSCLNGESSEVIDKDYRGVAAIMGLRSIPEFGAACIVASHAEEEAFAPVKSLELRLIVSMFVFCLMLAATSVYIAKSIVRPVKDLTKVARAIAAGDYTARAGTGGNDEIAELAASFNFMTNELYEQSAHLEHQVRERTKELEQTQQETAALLRRNQALMNNSLDGIAITDVRGNLVEVNDAFCRKLGYARDEISGLNASDWETQPVEELRARFSDLIGKSATFETSYRCKDGSLINVEVSAAGMEIEGRQYVFSSSRDITARKQVESRLLQSLSSLQATNKALDEFTYIAAHDLKEPLRGIHNYTSFLKEDYGDRLAGNARQYIDSIQRLAERLSALIDRLLAYSRLGSTELEKKPVDVDAVVGEVVEDLSRYWMAPAQGGMGIELRLTGPLGKVQGDATRIGEVFQNLIANAAKYNDKPRKWIEIGCDRSGAPPVFYVRDNGIGIVQHHLDSVFRIFKRLHEQNKYGGGTGAGLTIAKKIIELHGGRIWLESIPGEGTVFHFTLSEGA